MFMRSSAYTNRLFWSSMVVRCWLVGCSNWCCNPWIEFVSIATPLFIVSSALAIPVRLATPMPVPLIVRLQRRWFCRWLSQILNESHQFVWIASPLAPRTFAADCTARDKLLNKLVDRNGFNGRRIRCGRWRWHTDDGNDCNDDECVGCVLMWWRCDFVSIAIALRGRVHSSRCFTCDKNPSV